MQGPVLALVIAAAAAVLAGCATPVDVTVDDLHDFSLARTWEWASRTTHAVDLDPGDERTLDALAARLVDAALARRGLARGTGGADLLVGYTLEVRRRLRVSNETGAVDLLASHHASPSYLVQSTQKRVEVVHDGHLLVVVTDGPSGRVVWRGAIRTAREVDFARELSAAVSELFERFPGATGASRGAISPDRAS